MNLYIADERLLAIAKRMRVLAEPVGPMHGLWESIFDIEALVAEKPTLLTREQIIIDALRWEAKHP